MKDSYSKHNGNACYLVRGAKKTGSAPRLSRER
jgi:hypothetical protein